MPVKCQEIAKPLGVPAAYLAKIMQALCKHGLVDSYRGRFGGFALASEPAKINLMHILRITEGQTYTTTCLLGLKLCSDSSACPAHYHWLPIKAEICSMLEQQNLALMSDAVMAGRYRITDLPTALIHRDGKVGI